MACPLCDQIQARASWLGSILYRGKEFPYSQCVACGTLYCDPMPDEQVLAQMYGVDYGREGAADPLTEDPKEPLKVAQWLERKGQGTFIDYGCGSGNLLAEAQRLGWQAVGVEFDPKVARSVERKTGARVISRPEEIAAAPRADVLHLGDVIEHLTKLNEQMPEILKLIKPGGMLLAQGPLEANASLFTLMLRFARRLRRRPNTEMAPYHVLLATAEGQRVFFERFGLEQLEYTLHEVDWPAPSRLSLDDLARPRACGLFTLRKLSQSVSALRPAHWGNRYFYAGRLNN